MGLGRGMKPPKESFALYDEDGAVVVPRLERAHSLASQARGLLGRASLSREEGLWLEPCNGVHTIGMRFSIDVVYLNREGRALRVREGVAPYRICPPVRSARVMLELSAGAAQSCGIQTGKRYHIGRG